MSVHELIPLKGCTVNDKLHFSLNANHEYYDSLHSIHFQSTSKNNLTGKIKLTSGDNQFTRTDVIGIYQFIPEDKIHGELIVTDIVENDTFSKKIDDKKTFNNIHVKYSIDNTRTYIPVPYGGNRNNPLECKFFEHNCSMCFEVDPIYMIYYDDNTEYRDDHKNVSFFDINKIEKLGTFIENENTDITSGKDYIAIQTSFRRNASNKQWITNTTKLLSDLNIDISVIDKITKIMEVKHCYNIVSFYNKKCEMIGVIISTNMTIDGDNYYAFYPYIYMKSELKNNPNFNLNEYLLSDIDMYSTIHLVLPEDIIITDDMFPKHTLEHNDLCGHNMMKLIQKNNFNVKSYESYVLIDCN